MQHDAGLETTPQRHEVKARDRGEWLIRVFQEGDSFIADCVSPEGEVHSTGYRDNWGMAYNDGCNLVDQLEKESADRKYHQMIKPFVLMLLYLTGGYQYYEDKLIQLNAPIRYPYSWDVLDLLESEKLLYQPQKYKKGASYVSLTQQGAQLAQELLGQINFPELKDFLKDKEFLALPNFSENEDSSVESKEKDQ